jgi:hypothetical protein
LFFISIFHFYFSLFYFYFSLLFSIFFSFIYFFIIFIGGLLSFPQERRVVGGPCGEHEGNLQVGWWKSDNTNMNKNRNENGDGNENDKNNNELKNNARLSNLFAIFGKKEKSVNPLITETVGGGDSVDKSFVQPVFMDIWRKEYVNTDENKTKMTVIPRSALYVREKNRFGVFQRVYITRNFDSKDPITGAARDNYDDEFIELDGENIFSSNSIDKDEKIRKNNSNNKNEVEGIEDGNVAKDREINYTGRKAKLAARFSRIEDIPAWERGEIPAGTVSFVTPPTGKSLVLFDSVCLPHEVMLTVEGNRLALAGWMHETQQDVPKWFDLTS